jgi:hypothetical protein
MSIDCPDRLRNTTPPHPRLYGGVVELPLDRTLLSRPEDVARSRRSGIDGTLDEHGTEAGDEAERDSERDEHEVGRASGQNQIPLWVDKRVWISERLARATGATKRKPKRETERSKDFERRSAVATFGLRGLDASSASITNTHSTAQSLKAQHSHALARSSAHNRHDSPLVKSEPSDPLRPFVSRSLLAHHHIHLVRPFLFFFLVPLLL